MRRSTKLIYSIDAFRTIAIFGVICAHVAPFRDIGGAYDYLAVAIQLIARFSIPFFSLSQAIFLLLNTKKVMI